ncbi:tenascin-X [Pogona vitticeps]
MSEEQPRSAESIRLGQVYIMGWPLSPVSFLLFLFWLGASWEAHVPQPVTIHHPSTIPSNATVFSHVYTIKLAGDVTEGEVASSSPQEALGPPGSSRGGGLFEHTLEGPDQEHVVFTHRINLPPQTCGCPPGTEDTRELLRRLQALENEVRTLRNTCQAGGGGCCPAASTTQASTGQTDIRTLCSHHGSFNLSRCQCDCEPGWGGPTCAEPACPRGCGGPQRGRCVNGRCQCHPGYSGVRCEEPPSCPDDCNDQGRCVDGRCQCFQGYVGPSCSDPACPEDCQGRGKCVSGRCLCDPGYSGADCGSRACPSNCNRRGECRDGRCVCEPGFTGPACGTKACPNHCNQRGRCLKGGVCECHKGYTGPDCGQLACPEDCSGHGECQNGVCLCHDGYSGDDCAIEIPSIGIHVSHRDETSFRLEWNRPEVSVDGYEVHVVPMVTGYLYGKIASAGIVWGGESVWNGCVIQSKRKGREKKTHRIMELKEAYKTIESNPLLHAGIQIKADQKKLLSNFLLNASSVGSAHHLKERQDGESIRLPGSETVFERKGLKPGEEYVVTIRTEKGQRYGPPVTQTVRTRVAPPYGLQSSRVTEDSMTLQWEPPSSPPDGYILSYIPVGAPRPAQAAKRIELPATPESVTLTDLESNTRYRLTLIARQKGENSRATSIVVSTTALAPRQPVRRYSTPSPSFQPEPGASSSSSFEPENWKPSTGSQPGPSPFNSTSRAKELFLRKMTQNISDKLSSYNGTLLERLESYLRATNFPAQGNRTIEAMARDIYLYLVRWKPKEFQERVKERLVEETSDMFPPSGSPVLGGAKSVYSEGYLRPEHAKPSVITSSPDGIEVSLDGVRGVSDNVVIRFRNTKDGAGGEVVVPGDTSMAVITGLDPGTTYQVEIHGVVKGHSSKSYSFITSTAPASPTPAKTQPVPTTTLSPEVPLKDLAVTDVSPNSLRVTWSAQPNAYRSFTLQYRDPKSATPPGEIRVPGTERSVDVVGLSPRTEYELQLHGEKPSGRYDAPLTTKASTVAEIQKPSLGEISVLEVTDRSARLSWNVATGTFDSFLIQYKDADGKPKSVPVGGDSREATLSELVPSRKYKFNVYGLVGRKRFGPVSTEAVTAKADRKLTAPPSLGELSASDTTSDSVRLSWSVPSGNFDSFVVQYKDAEGRPQVLPVEGDAREVTIPSLAPSRRYRFNLYGIASRKRLGPATTDVTTAAAQETAPKPLLGDLSVLEATSDSVRLAWSVPEGHFDSFLLQYRDSEGKEQTQPVNRDSLEATVSNLRPSQTYRFNLYGISGDQRLGPVSADAATVPTAVSQETKKETPDEPLLPQPSLGELSVSEVTSDSLRLSWTVPTGNFDSFLIQYKDSEGKTQMLPTKGSSRERTISNLAPSHRYKFNLYGVAGRKRSGPISADATTASQDVEAQAEIQPSLGELSVSDITRNSVRLSWTVPAGNFDSFLVQYKDADGKLQSLPVQGDSREVLVPNLAPSHRYKFNLYGVSGRKRSAPVWMDATTAPASPTPAKTQPVPTTTLSPEVPLKDLAVTDVSPNSLRVTWSAQPNAYRSFALQYRDPKSTAPPGEIRVPGTERSVDVVGLSPRTEYELQLHGEKPSGRYDAPLTTKASTASQDVEEQDAVPPSLGELSVSEVTPDSVRLSWTVLKGNFDSFLVQYKDSQGKTQALPVEGVSREVHVSSLVPSHRYKFNLFGVSGRKRVGPLSTEATTASTTTSREGEAAAQPILGELSVSDVSSRSIHLSWTVQSGNFDSFLVQYKDAEGKLQTLPVERDFRDIIVPNLIPSRRYKFNLYGVSGRKRSAPVSMDATTGPAPSISPEEVDVSAPTQPRLGKLLASNISSDSLRLSWTILAGNFDSFLIQYKDAEGKPQARPVDGGALREVTISDLAPSHRYQFNLYGVSGLKQIGPISTEAETGQLWPQHHFFHRGRSDPCVMGIHSLVLSVSAPLMEKPTPPIRLGELTAANARPNSLDLSWTVEEGNFDSFIVQYRDAQGKPQALPVDGSLRSLHLHDLAPSHRYKINLYGIFGRKRLGPVSTEAVTAPLPTTPPPRPTLGQLSVSNVTRDSVHLSWTVPTGSFDSFVIQYKDAEGKPQSLPVEGETREVTVPGLVPSRRYKFNLYGVSGKKRVGPISTDTLTASLPEEPPSLGELSVSDITSDSVRLSWTIRTGSFDTFLIQYKDAQGKPQSIPVEGVFRELTVPNLVPSRRYKFNLYGVTSRNKRLGPVSTDAVTASPPAETIAPPSLGQLSVSNLTTDSAHLSWTVRTGNFDSFLIQYKDAEGKTQALPLEGNAREATIPGLSPSRRYKFNLFGLVGRKRLGPVSADAVTASTVKKEEPAKPSLGDLSVSDITSNSALLSWTVATGNFDSFLIQYKDAEGKTQALPVEGTSREVTVSNLAPSRRYKFNLFGLFGRKRLGPVSSEATTVKPEEEEQKEEEEKEEEDRRHKPRLGELKVSETNSDFVRLSWSVPTGSFDSFLVQYEDGEDDIQTLPVDGTAREVTVPNLVPSQRYRFELYGISKGERLGPASTSTITAPAAQEQKVQATATPPPEPKLGELSVSEVTGDSVRLSWDVPTGTYDSFLVQYVDAEDNPQEIPVDKETNSIVIYYLVPSYRYIFYLYGVSGRRRLEPISVSVVTVTTGGEAEEEEEKAENEGPDGTEPRLGELSVSEVTSDAARLSWTVPTGSFDSFSVQYKDADGKPQALPVGGDAREVLIPSLSPSHKYRFNLYGISGKQRLGPISASAVTTATAGDKKPQEVGPKADKEIPRGMQAPRLGKLSVSEVTSDAARLSWTVPAGSFDSFSVQYKDAEGRPQALPVGGDAQEVLVPNLAPSHKYKFNLFGISGKQRFGPVSANAVTTASTGEEKQQDVREEAENEGPAGTEPRLGQLSVSEVTSDAARLSWTVPAGSFDSFSVQYKDAKGRPQELPVGGDAREVLVPNLAPSHKYKFNLFGISGQRRLGPISANAVTTGQPMRQRSTVRMSSLDFSLTIFVLTLALTGEEKQQDVREEAENEGPAGIEPRLGDLSVSEVTSDAARLSWTVPAGSFDSFSVQYKDAEGRPQALPVRGDAREILIPNLASSHKYKFNLFGISGQRRLGPVSANAVTTASTGEEKQQDVREEVENEGPAGTEPLLGQLSVSEVTSDAARLSWTVPAGSFDSFSVQYKDAEGRPQALPVGGDAREVLIPSLSPSHKYRFSLYGISGKQRLGPISANAVTTGQPMNGCLWQAACVHGSSQRNALRFQLPSLFFLQVAFLLLLVLAASLEDIEAEVHCENVQPGFLTHSLTIFVLTLASTGEEKQQDVREEAENEGPAGTEPRLGQLSVSEVTSDAARLSWTVPAGSFDSFSVQYKDAKGRPQALPVGGDAREVLVSNLAPSHKYKFNLFGISGQRRLGPVSANAVTTASTGEEKQQDVREEEEDEGPASTEPRLGQLSVSEVTSDAARLSWTVPAGSFDSFSVQYKDAEGRPQALPVGGDAREVLIPSLSPSHKYRFNLYGISGKQRLGPISANAVTTASTGEEKQQDVREEAENEGPAGTEPRLGQLSVSEVTSDAARLSWTVPAGSFDSFSVQYKDAKGRPLTLPVGGDAREVLIPSLSPSHKYRFNLYGISGKQRLGPVSANAVTTGQRTEASEKEEVVFVAAETPGEAPVEEKEPGRSISSKLGDLVVSEVTPDSLLLSWSIREGSFDSFLIQYKDAAGKLQVLPVDGAMRSLHLYNLTPSQRYEFNVFGLSGNRRLGPVSTNAVTAPEQPQEEEAAIQPRLGDLLVSKVASDSVSLSWSVPAGHFDSFLLQYKDAEGRPQVVPLNGDSRDVTVPNLASSHRYKFNLYGISGPKRLGPISTDAVTGPRAQPEKRAPLRLGELSAQDITAESVLLSWTVEIGNFDSFIIQYRDAEGKPHALPVDGSMRSLRLHDLVPSHRYRFNLYGVYGRKRFGPISTEAVTAPLERVAPPQPSLVGFSASDINDTSVRLSWSVLTGIFDSFIVQFRDAEGKPQAFPVGRNVLYVIISNLVPSHKYKFNLYGISGRKRIGPISVEAVTAEVKQPEIQPTLGDFSISEVTQDSVRLSWTISVGNFDSFFIQYKDAEGQPQSIPVEADARTVVISDLIPSHRYKFNLYGLSGSKKFGPISIDAVTGEQSFIIFPTPKKSPLTQFTFFTTGVMLGWHVRHAPQDLFLGYSFPAPFDSNHVCLKVRSLDTRVHPLDGSGSLTGPWRPCSSIHPSFSSPVAFPDAESKPATILLDHLVVSEVTPTSLQLTWKVSEGEVDSFLVRSKESLLGSGRSPPPAKEVAIAGDKHSAVLRGLTPNTEYSLTVYGIRDGSEVANINTGARTSGLELDSPRDLRFSDIRETSVVANWRPPTSRIDRYKVSVQPSDGGEPRSIAVNGSRLRTAIEDLTPGASYEVTVVSIRGFEESEPLVGYVTTVPDGPSDLRAINVTDSSAVLTWHPPLAEMNNYIVTYGPLGGPRVSESVPGNRVQLRLSGLRRDTEYRASIYGEKEGNRSSPISATFTTGADGPRDLRASEISARSARLTWSPPRASPGGYLLSYETPSGQSKEIPLGASVTSHELQDLIPSSRYQVQVQALRRGTPTAPTSTSFTTEHLTYPFPRDCSEESMNGPGPSRVTTIYLGGNRERPVQVYCDMETDGGGWIVFQRRMNGETDFWRDWQDYATGFGNLTREFWLGNDALHQLTSSGDYELRVDLRAGKESVYATYQSFRVDPPADYYRLHLGSYNGTAGDAFSYHSGSVFSTRDRDPNRLIIPCAVSYRGAWWYRNCHYTNLNGLYANNRDHQGVNWFNWKGFEFSIPFTEMKLRPRGFQPLRRA